MPVIFVRLLWNLNFLHGFAKNTHASNFTKILSVGDQLFHAYGQADMTKLRVAFPNAPTNVTHAKSKTKSQLTANMLLSYEEFLQCSIKCGKAHYNILILTVFLKIIHEFKSETQTARTCRMCSAPPTLSTVWGPRTQKYFNPICTT
jgi:hypothetical protein